MQPRMLNPQPFPALSAIRIDCSRSPEAAIQSMVDWISSHPERAAMHVVLPSMRGQAAHRQALGSLMILGCRVTAKI